MNIKSLVVFLINKTNYSFFCFLRNILEFVFLNQNFNLKYLKSGLYLREYKDLGSIYFPNKYRSIMYGRGASFRLETLGKFYFLDKLTFTNGDKIIDCGANIGEINLFFKRKNINIDYYAFEPSIKDFECLKLNVENKNLFQKALWINQSIKTFYIKSNSADSSIFEINDYESKIDIETINLDSLKLKKIKLFKVEAEGAEPEVLLGSMETLKNCEYIVVDSGKERGKNKLETTMEVCNLLITNNFKLIDINHERITLLFKNNLNNV